MAIQFTSRRNVSLLAALVIGWSALAVLTGLGCDQPSAKPGPVNVSAEKLESISLLAEAEYVKMLESLPKDKDAFRKAVVDKFSEGDETIRAELEGLLGHFAEFNPLGELRTAHLASMRARSMRADYPDARGHIGAARKAEEGDFADIAKAQYEKAISKDPSQSEAHAGLARCALRLGKVDEALAGAQRAVELAPDRPGWHILYGDVLYAKEDTEGAAAAYQRAMKLNAKLPLPHEKMAVVLWKKKDFEGAKAEIAKCVELGGTPDPFFVKGLELDSNPDSADAQTPIEDGVPLAPVPESPVQQTPAQ